MFIRVPGIVSRVWCQFEQAGVCLSSGEAPGCVECAGSVNIDLKINSPLLGEELSAEVFDKERSDGCTEKKNVQEP